MQYLLFCLYLAVAAWFICNLSFVKKSGLKTPVILALFVTKILAGLAVGYIAFKFYPRNDYWSLHRLSLEEHDLLMSDPSLFFKSIFQSNYGDHYGGVFDSMGSYWNDLRTNLVLKILAICNIFSRGNYYINSVLFNSIGFLGHVAIYRVFISLYPNKNIAAITGCFLLPSMLYFSSGVHKDLLVFTALCTLFYCIFSVHQTSVTFKRGFAILVSVVVLWLFRNYVVIAIIPAFIALMISLKRKWNPVIVFPAIYLLLFAGLYVLEKAVPSFQPIKIITQKQQDFASIKVAASQLPMKKITPSVAGLAEGLPQAIDHGFFRPYPWENGGKFSRLMAIEVLAYLVVFIVYLVRSRAARSRIDPFVAFGIFLTLSIWLIIGLIIPNSSSIIRYKSLYLPLLITPMLCFLWNVRSKNNHIINNNM